MHATAMRGESLTDETGESYRWFIEEITRDLRDGLERFVPDSPNGDGPLYKGTQSLLQYDYDNNRNGADIWDNVYTAYGDVYELLNNPLVIYYAAYGCEWFVHMDSGENVCLSCASKEHGIYLQSDEYRTAVGLYADTADANTCEVFCSECSEQIKEHDDTDLKPCSECENIWAEVYEYETVTEGTPPFAYEYQKVTGHYMEHIEVPTFTRRIVSWRLWQGHTIMMMPACGHETFDIQQEEFRSYMSEWYATHRMMNYRYYGLGMPRWVIYCPVCFTDWIKATLTREDQICVECEGPIGWKRAYICKTAGKEPKHIRDYRYDNYEDEFGHSSRKIEWCVIGDDTGPIYEFDN